MAFNEIKYTQSVWHYQELKRKFWLEGENRVLSLYLRPPAAHCPKCRSRNVRANRHRDRTLIGLPNGKCQVRFIVPARKVACRDCKAVTYERIAFAAYKNARITRLLAKKLLARTADEGQQGQVCIASRGKVKKLCMEVNAGVSADVSIRALRGSGGL